MDTLLTMTALSILGYALFSRALARSGITMAMVFMLLGIFAAKKAWRFQPRTAQPSIIWLK